MMVARSLERSRPSLSMAGMSITSPVGNLAVELGVSSLVVQSTGSGRGAARSRGALHRRGVHGGGVGGLDAGAGVGGGAGGCWLGCLLRRDGGGQVQPDAGRPEGGLGLGGVVGAGVGGGGTIVRTSSRVGRLGQQGVGDPPAVGGGGALLDHGEVVDPAGPWRGR